MDETKFFTITQTAAFLQVPQAKICEWLKRCELIATLRNRQLMVSAAEIARMLSIYPERQPMGLDSGVGRVVRLKRIITSANRGLIPAREV